MTKFEGTDNKIAEAMEQIRSKIFLKRVVEKSDMCKLVILTKERLKIMSYTHLLLI
jgi:hypothetical protein